MSNTMSESSIDTLVRYVDEEQLNFVARWHEQDPEDSTDDLFGVIARQHLMNFSLWHEEDIARDPSVADSTIAQVKRAIDKYNQQRNNLIEKIDELLLRALMDVEGSNSASASLNSETPGSMIDRASIMSLKIFHMSEEADRESAGEEHRQIASNKVLVLREQRADLLACLAEVLSQALAGTRRFKVYRQFKMYNDPSLNPRIYATGGSE